MTANAELARAIDAMPLIDHHAHSLLRPPLAERDLLDALTQAEHATDHAAIFDSQLGFALRRFCAPALGLPPFADAAEYLAARERLGFDEATRRLLGASGIRTYLIDDGHAPDRLLSDAQLAELASEGAGADGDRAGAAGDVRVHRIVRLERLAESVMSDAASGADFVDRLPVALEAAAASAVGFKTVAAYRGGLALDPAKPSPAELAEAAEAWHAASRRGGAASVRLVDPVIIRHLAWWALERGDAGGPGVLQVHVGFGDPDLRLDRADPFLLQPFIAATQATGGRIALLHCHPYLREASMLAHLFPHVFLDAGLAVAHVGANADTLVRESLDLAPFSKVLFSTDAWGVPERVLLGAAVWRDATTRVLGSYVAEHGWPVDEAIRVAELIAWRNADALYGRSFLEG
ncbi:amidohydrolase [Agromyces mariniharenae]|uniref:Amidohydrolase n=1 Tax=Agromyces mariniharenae TaxID=2604423 RepID=A0A5S4V7H6_9MICO|nr:amidohydrolase [Agromyces mariniharenae]TYL54048.1 amidohydrolase [Agromyces mariniharenae]